MNYVRRTTTRRFYTFAAALSIVLTTALTGVGQQGGAQAPVAGQDPVVEPISSIQSRLDFLGFTATASRASDLIVTKEGIESYLAFGVPVVGSERAELLERERTVDLSLPLTRKLLAGNRFGGSYLNHKGGGVLEVRVVNLAAGEDQKILQIVPDDRARQRIRLLPATKTLDTLSAEARSLIADSKIHLPNIDVTASAVDPASGGLTVYVAPGSLMKARDLAPAISRRLGSSVTVEERQRAVPTPCSSRNNCTGPIKAGVSTKLVQNSNNATVVDPYCTMGFMVWAGGESRFLTSGHCTEPATQSWWHGPVQLGQQQSTLYTAGSVDGVSGSDVKSVQFAGGWHHSNQVYRNTINETLYVTGYWSIPDLPAGSTVCKSGRSSYWTCGNTLHQITWWSYAPPNPTFSLIGNDSTIYQIGGDSGAPVVRLPYSDSIPQPGANVRAIGINSASNLPGAQVSYYADIHNSLVLQGLTLRTTNW